MLRARLLRLAGFALATPLLLLLANSPLHSQATAAANGGSTADSTSNQSDPQAIQALRNVLDKSGGRSAWASLRSAKEIFSVANLASPKDKNPTDATASSAHVIHLLDDWSTEKTHYRRGIKDQTAQPVEHNGDTTFAVKSRGESIALPEFDQARALVDRLPAAAAEIILRRGEYVVNISSLQSCEIGIVCVDVFRRSNSVVGHTPEQQWKISASTGLPVSIRYQMTSSGSPVPLWEEVYFLKYAVEQQLDIPTSIAKNMRGRKQVWTFVSLMANPRFDSAQFDQEVGQ